MKNGTFAPDIIFSKLLKCKKYFWKIFENFNYSYKMMQCSKYSIWGKGLMGQCPAMKTFDEMLSLSMVFRTNFSR